MILKLKSNPKEHKTINLLIRLLPYIHFKYNFICFNPEEENIELIKPLKQAEILEILNIAKRTGSKLLSFKIKEWLYIRVKRNKFSKKEGLLFRPKVLEY